MGCGCKSTNLERIDEQNQSAIDMLVNKPEWRKYKQDSTALKNADNLWSSQVFGSKIFDSTAKTTLTTRNVQNPLLDELKKQPVSVLYGGGFYTLKNVKWAANVYCDIWMLIESVDEQEKIKLFHQYNNLSQEERRGRDGLKFDNIKKHLTGYGRVIYFQTNNHDFKESECSLIKMHEGRFKQGEPDGYCRIFTCPKDGQCELGYFKEGKPQGKYQRFDIRGHCNLTGIMEGDHLTKSCEINSYQTRLIKTANDSVGRKPETKRATVTEFERREPVQVYQEPEFYNAPVDRQNPYGYDVHNRYAVDPNQPIDDGHYQRRSYKRQGVNEVEQPLDGYDRSPKNINGGERRFSNNVQTNSFDNGAERRYSNNVQPQSFDRQGTVQNRRSINNQW